MIHFRSVLASFIVLERLLKTLAFVIKYWREQAENTIIAT